MSLTMSDYMSHILTANTFQPIAKVEVLYQDETLVSNGVFTGRILEGSLSVNLNNGARRSVSLKLANYDLALNPSPDIFWVNQKFALYLGFKINGEDFFIKQGVLAIKDPSLQLDGSMWVLNITGEDKWSLLDASLAGRLLSTLDIPIGTNVNSAVQSVLSLPEINDPQPLIADASTFTTPYTLLSTDKVASSVISELGNMISRNYYYDTNGSLNMRDDIDDTLKPSLYDFGASGDKHYQGGVHTSQFSETYNVVTVIGATIQGDIASYQAINSNDASPISINRIGYKIMDDIEDANISTDYLAQLRAEYELKKVSRLYSQIQFSIYPMFHLDVDEVCTITDSNAGLDHEPVIINSYTINFGSNPTMTINATRTQDLLFDLSA